MNRSQIPARCDCGTLLESCVACASPRCTSCEPYVSDDCDIALAPAS